MQCDKYCARQTQMPPKSPRALSVMLTLLAVLMLLVSLTLCFSSAAWSEEIQSVPQGWRTPSRGYWMTEAAGRDILIGWKKDREERDIYKAAVKNAEAELKALRDMVTEEFAAMKDAHEADRAAWKKKLRSPGLGVFAGVGYTTNDSVEGVVGLGFVVRF